MKNIGELIFKVAWMTFAPRFRGIEIQTTYYRVQSKPTEFYIFHATALNKKRK